MRNSTNTVAAATLAIILIADKGHAEVPSEWRLYVENDYLNPFTERTDRYYTQGMRIERLSGQQSRDAQFLPGLTHSNWCSLFCGSGHRADDGEVSIESGYAFGQNMYTPADITIAPPQPYDRPWAGMSYVSRIARISYRDGSLKMKRQDQIEMSVGIVGPASLAGKTQVWWHDLWGFDEPKGWDNQLRNEPVLQLRYETAIRWQPERYCDVTPRLRGNLGNALVSLEAEIAGRIGWNLSGFGVPSIPGPPPALASAFAPQVNASRGARWLQGGNLFARVGIKAVAHNILLDGNTFARNDIRIDRKPFVPEIAVGTEWNLVNNVRLTFQFIRRGSEFWSLGRDAPAQEYGAITIAWGGRGR